MSAARIMHSLEVPHHSEALDRVHQPTLNLQHSNQECLATSYLDHHTTLGFWIENQNYGCFTPPQGMSLAGPPLLHRATGLRGPGAPQHGSYQCGSSC